MEFKSILFNDFSDRDYLLKKIKRFSMYKTMFFRTDVEFHSRRMEWIALDLLPCLAKNTKIDSLKLRLLCRVHDDVEIFTGDHQLGRKTYTMKKEELTALKKEEENAMDLLSEKWPKTLEGFVYHDLLTEAAKHETLESQTMKLIDRLDAYGESAHEIYSGNLCFLSHQELPKGVNPIQTYTQILKDTPQRFPLLVKLFDGFHPFLSPPKEIDQEEILKSAFLPNKFSIKTKTNNPHYDIWKEITLKYGGLEGLNRLILQME